MDMADAWMKNKITSSTYSAFRNVRNTSQKNTATRPKSKRATRSYRLEILKVVFEKIKNVQPWGWTLEEKSSEI